jgi:hypothetical protein
MRLVLDLGIQYLPRFVKQADETLPKAPLRLMQCENCSLLQLGDTTNPDLLYREFWYRSSVNETMRAALSNLVAAGLFHHQGGVWLDIGANDGYLLSRVPQEFHRVAVEPAKNLKHLLEEHSDLVISDYFKCSGKIKGVCDVVTSAAMFYDLDEPGKFLDDIASVLHPEGVWINQLNDAPTMMRQNAFDAICHEHLCYYDVPSLDRMYREHGLAIIDMSVNDVNGGSIRVTAKRFKNGTPAEFLGHGQVTHASADAFAKRIERWKRAIDQVLALYPSVWCYGASTKGTVLLQYLGGYERFQAVADRNPAKHGLKMAGSWLPIVSEDTLRIQKPPAALVLPWAFKEEFNLRETELRSNGTAMIYPLPNIEIVV